MSLVGGQWATEEGELMGGWNDSTKQQITVASEWTVKAFFRACNVAVC